MDVGWNGDFTEVLLRQRRRSYGIAGSVGESLKAIGRAFGKQSSSIYFLVALAATSSSRSSGSSATRVIATSRCLPSKKCRAANCVEEVGGPTVWDVARNQTCVSLFALRPALGRGAGSALPTFGSSGRWQRGEELVLGPRWPSQPEPVEAQDALEMREQHLDLLTFTPRRHVGLGLGDVARNVPGVLVN
jgi:hypothetical protein